MQALQRTCYSRHSVLQLPWCNTRQGPQAIRQERWQVHPPHVRQKQEDLDTVMCEASAAANLLAVQRAHSAPATASYYQLLLLLPPLTSPPVLILSHLAPQRQHRVIHRDVHSPV